MKKLALLGSTGSIGTQTLEIVRANKDIKITALTAAKNIDLLEAQIREFHPELACAFEPEAAAELAARVADTDTKILSGMDGLTAAASQTDADIVLTAVVGMVGIRPTLAAIEAGKDIALANKETLVTAGHLVIEAAARRGIRIFPVDSEHSAIFQCLQGNEGNKIDKILLTCSGGPFRGLTLNQMRDKTPADALKHPSWSMGSKITIDSATHANKGLEVMEATWLFGVSPDQIQVVVHPGSIIHSMVQFEDGAVMGQLGTPDMKIPIQYALYYPQRLPLDGERLDLFRLGRLIFEKPDFENFPALRLAFEAARAGGTTPTVFNAANEWSVARFLRGEIGFTCIADNIGRAMAEIKSRRNPSLEDILEAEAQTYALLENR
ncbi:MAG: 1-deoxy-D-xylulose-5-phosphate reductoisomerase [Lachnospiraceae bacterium]|nr:1-deoxy-D-xylulose-5-phosphate reductoisomerase [Lachnospiraceae bacterium]